MDIAVLKLDNSIDLNDLNDGTYENKSINGVEGIFKSDEATKNIPVVIFSSLINDDMRRKGVALGADAQLTKPEIGNLVRTIDELITKLLK